MPATSFEEMLREERVKREKLILEYEGQFRGDVFLAITFPQLAFIPGMLVYWLWMGYCRGEMGPFIGFFLTMMFGFAVIGLAFIVIGIIGLVGACRSWFRLRKLRKASFFDPCWNECSH